MPDQSRPWYRDLLLVALVCFGFGLPAVTMLVMLGNSAVRNSGAVLSLLALVAYVLVVRRLYRGVQERGVGAFGVALDALVFAWLPAWGLLVNHYGLSATCVRDTCSGDMDVFRAFAEPWVLGPLALHIVTALAYVVSKRRPARLPASVEALVLALMMTGVALQVALSLQLGVSYLLVGLVVFPIGLPVIMPLVALGLLLRELHARLMRRGDEERAAPNSLFVGDLYRQAEVPGEAPPSTLSRHWLTRGLALSPVIVGGYGVLAAVLTGRASAGASAFTQTCAHTFSAITVRVIERECHYLCTVAARGHGWLVRPERVGVRNGTPIVVNRQLALANAFEDLLHQRWPPFGAWCRRVYDRVGLPVSRYIVSPWASDLVYLAMKPAEWAFYLALLLLDRDDPERRIDRMYR